ncbi:olfactory receptor 14J1-like [Passer domesticus]|uniref:olfactory receptor 14J1-like n=2 Tax=Passer domesticus TaxID=48849 RepID=UPI0030FF1C7F
MTCTEFDFPCFSWKAMLESAAPGPAAPGSRSKERTPGDGRAGAGEGRSGAVAGPGPSADSRVPPAGKAQESLQERYRLGSLLGRGGFGSVFAATRLSDGAPVAIKRVPRNRIWYWSELPDGTSAPLEVVLQDKVSTGFPGVVQLLEWLELPSDIVMDLGSICTTVPKAMHNSLWHTRNISYTGCVAQLFFFLFFISAELSLLTIMCYDRYVSICKPLHYGTLLGSRACAHMAAAAWASAFLYSLLHTANTFSLPLCHGNALGQFFCEVPQILKLSCSKSYLRELGLIVFSVSLAIGCFVFIVFSYMQIFKAVLRIPSEQGRHKAFSTCLPHLAVVSLFISTAAFAHLKPPSISSPSLDLSVSVLYSVVTPALNPLIYSLRNQELQDALQKMMTISFQGQ